MKQTKKFFFYSFIFLRRVLLLILCAFFLFSPVQPLSFHAQGRQLSARPLRIYWRQREQMNPLATFDLSGTAVMKLCYRGLFRIDAEERLRSDLADSAEWSPDKCSLTLALRKDERFSDGSALDAGDAAASILARRAYLKQELEQRGELPDTGDEKAAPVDELAAEENAETEQKATLSQREEENYLQRLLPDPDGYTVLNKITDLKALPDGRLRIDLREPDLRLPWVLTFPILPQESVSDLSMKVQAGIGSWQLRRDAESGRLSLNPQASVGERELQIVSAEDEREAIRRFNAGEIDLLLLSPENFTSMSRRLDLRSLGQETDRLNFFLSGFAAERPLSDSHTRDLFRAYSELWPQNSVLCGSAVLPFHKNDWRLLGSRDRQSQGPDPALASRLKAAFAERELIISGAEGPRSRAALDALDERMSPLGCRLKWQGLSVDWQPAAAAGNYDLIFASLRLAPPYQAESLAAYLAAISLELAPLLPSRLDEELMPLGLFYAWDLEQEQLDLPLLQQSREAVERAFRASAFFSAGFEMQGLIFSRCLRGSLASSALSPYEGIESLEIWE